VNSSETKTLWQITRGERLRYGASMAVQGVSIAALMVVPLLVRWAIDGLRAGSEQATPLLARAALGCLAATAVAGGLQYLRGRWAAQSAEGIVRRLRGRLYAHLCRLPCAYHDRADTGDLVQRCTSDVETVRVFFAAQVVEIGRAVLLILVAVPVLISISPVMTLVACAFFPLIVGFAWVYFGRLKTLFQASDEAEGELTTVLQENLTGIRVVRAFARQDFERTKFGAKNALFRDRTRRLIEALGSYWAISDLLCFAQIGLVLLVGAHRATQGHLTVGELNAVLMIEAMVIWPMRQLGRILSETGRALVALGRIGEILGEPEEPAIHGGLAPAGGELVFERISFGYDAGQTVLHDVSFRVAPGEVLVLVGPPGAGKSTIVRLLLRLYEYTRGSIRLDGAELRDLDPTAVRRCIGTVLQEPFLYAKSVRDNLLLGRQDAAEEELVHAATAACIHTAIQEFDAGYATLVGERGVTLSGGQRQRVAIARALLKDPPILVLDDSLSAVDTRTEADILGALEERRGRRTTILITHRLSAAVRADRICVLDHGRVVQSGNHAELLATEGPYRRLWLIQEGLEAELELEPHAGPLAVPLSSKDPS